MIGGTIVPQIQGAVATAGIVKNILAGLVPSISGIDTVALLAKDIGGFEFDYIGEERLEAGVDITDHYTEDNLFMQDHRAIKPTIYIARGFAAEVVFKKNSIVGSILQLQSALAPVQPYLSKYAPGTTARMANALDQTDQIVEQLASIGNTIGSIAKLVGLFAETKVQQAYNTLDALRTQGTTFAVVTPFATFGDPKNPAHGPMMIENLTMVEPDETRGWADIVVRLKEIRVAPSLGMTTQDNARAPGASTNSANGTVSASTP